MALAQYLKDQGQKLENDAAQLSKFCVLASSIKLQSLDRVGELAFIIPLTKGKHLEYSNKTQQSLSRYALLAT
eukprot:scaffold61179_cov19-Tisochrysis_lutea.AAC.1